MYIQVISMQHAPKLYHKNNQNIQLDPTPKIEYVLNIIAFFYVIKCTSSV